MRRWTIRPDGSTWGDFGVDDQIGRLNLLTEAKVLQGIREVEVGKVFCLSLPLDMPGGNALNPRRHPPSLRPTYKDGRPYMNVQMGEGDCSVIDVLSDDQVTLCLQYSTQWDGLSHIGARFDVDGDGNERMVYYNGYRAGDHVIGGGDEDREHGEGCRHAASGALKLGIENYAQKGMQGHGVLVDLVRHFGPGRTLVDYDKLARVIEIDRLDITQGDMLVLRTGFAEAVVAMGGNPDHETLNSAGAVLDGSDERLLNWITDSGIATICSDNYAVEAYPARTQGPRRSVLPLHHHCLFKLGLPLAELWYLKDLADWLHANRRNAFLLTAPPLRLPGAVGSPVTPIATV